MGKDIKDLNIWRAIPRSNYNLLKLKWNSRAMTWRLFWTLGIGWEGHRCTMRQAKKQVPTKDGWRGWTCFGSSEGFILGLSYISNLLKAGANIDAQDHSGMTPLHLACRFGNISLVWIAFQDPWIQF